MILAAGTTGTIIATVAAFLLITLVLVALLLFVKQKLSPSGPVTITINGEKEIEVASGSTLLTTLGNEKIFLPSACGGGGSCIQCECHVLEGGGEALPTETPHFTRKELKSGARLACQVKGVPLTVMTLRLKKRYVPRLSVWDLMIAPDKSQVILAMGINGY